MVNQNQTHADEIKVALAAKNSGDPVLLFSAIPAVCTQDTDADGDVVVATHGIYTFPYTVAAAVAVGAPLYLNAGVMDDADDDTTGVVFGYAMEAIGAGGSGTVKVLLK